MRSLLLVPGLLLACTGGTEGSSTGPSQTEIDLGSAFDRRPWEQTRGGPMGPLELRARFPLTEAPSGSALVLEGLWWKADVRLNGQDLAPVTGGNAPVEIPLGEALKPGENELVLRISPPSGEVPLLTGGGLASSSFQPQQPALQVAPRLILRPEAHVAWAALPLSGETVAPVARVEDAPAGARVHFQVALDGEILADLGRAPVGADGRAAAAPVDWKLDRWEPGEPALYQLLAVLEDERGRTLDTLSTRTGAREVQADKEGIRINGEARRLIGARVTNRPDLGTLEERFGALLPGGVNALEIHGELLRSSWLDLADEVGLPVVVLPRCIGRTRRGSEPTAAILAEQEAQDQRFLAHLADRPAALLWVGEGPSPSSQRNRPLPIRMWTDQLLQDPLARPIVQHHLPDRLLQTGPADESGTIHHTCQREPCQGSWLVELTYDGPNSPEMWPLMATVFGEALKAGAVGGVVPTPERHDRETWARAFAPMADAAGAEPFAEKTHRSRSTLRVTGGRPGQLVLLRAPRAGTVGAILDSSGQAELSLWHEGLATLVAGGIERPVELKALRRQGLKLEGDPVVVDLGGAGRDGSG